MSYAAKLKRIDESYSPEILFDIGANVGQTTKKFLNLFPNSKIYSFEALPDTFAMLKEAVGSRKNLILNNIALDSHEGTAEFVDRAGHPGNYLLWRSNDNTLPTVKVSTITGDAYCEQNAISKIDFLKIDTEGNDQRVLVGFSNMLRKKSIQYIQVECTTNFDNRFHVHIEQFMRFLHPFGYRLADIFKPRTRDNKTGQVLNGIWFCDAIFVAEVDNPDIRKDGFN